MNTHPLLMLAIVFLVGCAPKADLAKTHESRRASDTTKPVVDLVQSRTISEVNQIAPPDAVSLEAIKVDVVAQSANGKLTLDVLPTEIQERLSACACTFWPRDTPDGSVLLVGWLDPSNGAFMQVNGKSENLKINNEVNQRAGGKDSRPEIGDKTTYLLSNAGYKSELVCRISSTCWQSSECESISYECDISIKSKDASLTTRASGLCGC